MGEPSFLTLEDLLSLVRDLGAGPVRDLGLLDAAAARPRSSLFGDDAYLGVPLKATALLHSLVRSHPLVDGNERLGWQACVVFLDLNGISVDISDDQAFEVVMDVVEGKAELAEVVERLGLS